MLGIVWYCLMVYVLFFYVIYIGTRNKNGKDKIWVSDRTINDTIIPCYVSQFWPVFDPQVSSLTVRLPSLTLLC